MSNCISSSYLIIDNVQYRSLTTLLLHACPCVAPLKPLNIPVTYLCSTRLVWHQAWLFHTCMVFLTCRIMCAFLYASLNVNDYYVCVFSKYIAMHELDTNKWNQLLNRYVTYKIEPITVKETYICRECISK